MKKALLSLLTIVCVSALLATTLMMGSLAGATDSTKAVVERNDATPQGTVEVKDGMLNITPTGESWIHTYTKNLNATAFGAADDVDITFDYKLMAHTWAELFHICVGGAGTDKQWGSVALRLEGNGDGNADLKAMTEGFALIKDAANVIVPGEWYTFRITVEKATGTLSVYVNKKSEAAATTPVLTVTDAEHEAAGGAANFISNLSGGLNMGACFQASQVDNVKLVAGGNTLLDDDFEPVVEKVYANVEQYPGSAANSKVEVKDGVLSITPPGGWGYSWTKNLNATNFGAADDVDITFDYKLVAREWADLAFIVIGGGGDAQWGGVPLRLNDFGTTTPSLEVLTEGNVVIKTVDNVFTVDTWYTFRVTVEKATGTLSVYVNKKDEAAATTPLVTLTDAEYEAAGGAANWISTLSGGLNFGAQFFESQIDNVKLVAGGNVLLNDDFSEIPVVTTTTTEATTTTTTTTQDPATVTTTTTRAVEVVSSVLIDFDEYLNNINVEKEKKPSFLEDTQSSVTLLDDEGMFMLECSNGNEVFSALMNTKPFAADQDVEIEFDFYGNNRDWSVDRVTIGAKGDKQWGGYVLEIPSMAEGFDTVVLKTEWMARLAGCGDENSLVWDLTWYHFRITVVKETGTINVWVTEDGYEETEEPNLSYTDEAIKTLEGGLAFSGWATNYVIDNLSMKADGEELISTDFSEAFVDYSNADGTEEGTVKVYSGALSVYGFENQEKASYAISKGILGVNDLTDCRISFEYNPMQTVWNVDKLILGYQNNGLETNCLTVEIVSENGPQKLVIKKNEDGTVTELASAAIALDVVSEHLVDVRLDTVTGLVIVSFTQTDGQIVTVAATDDFIKTLEGDFGFSSYAGYYIVDDIMVESYAATLPTKATTTTTTATEATTTTTEADTDTDVTTTTTEAGSESPDTGVAMPIAAVVVLLAVCTGTVVVMLNTKRSAEHK